MSSTEVKAPDVEAKDKALAIKVLVDALKVTDQASYDLAQDYNKRAYDGKKAFHVWFDPIDEASKAQRKTTIAQGKVVDDPYDYVISITGSRSAVWLREQEALAEKKRQEEEAKRRKAAEDRQLEEAELLQSMGLDEAAEEAISAAPVVEKVSRESYMPTKAAGTSLRDYYSAQVNDLMALVKAVAAGTAPLEAVEANMTYLNGRARLEKGGFKMPGCEAVVDSKQTRRS